jgi:cytochrome c-type biogenesis protein CcmH/NrfG
MIIFFSIATLFTCFTLWTLLTIWKRSRNVSEKTINAEWQVLLAKRNEIEDDVLLPRQTQDELRQEWTSMADAVLARNGSTLANPAGVAAGSARTVNPAQRHHWWLVAGSGVIGVALYAMLGRWDGDALQRVAPDLAQSPAAQQDLPMADGARHPGGTETIEDRIAKLEKKLQGAPDDLEGWVLLSRSRGIQRDFAGATAALEKALALAPGHPDILADLADVMAMTNNKSLVGRPLKLIHEALESAPGHRKALSLAATAAMQDKDIKLATDYWKRLRATFPAGAPDIVQVDNILASLGAAPGAPATPPAAPALAAPAAAPAGAAAAAIDGVVELSPALFAAL